MMVMVVREARREVMMFVLFGMSILYLVCSHSEIWWFVTRTTSNQLGTAGDRVTERAGKARWENAL